MITQINGEGVKGLSFKQPLGKLNLFVGPNGVGKSARCAALMLTILGYAPTANGKPIRKNDEILDAFGDGKKMFVGIETDDKTHLLRRFSRENDSVSQVQMVDRKKATREGFGQALAGMKALDLGAFLSLSDQKKIDTIFSLFPLSEDTKGLDARIEELKEKQNRTDSQLRTLGATIERLLKATAQIELPSGTAAETDKEIADTEAALKAARQQLLDARVESGRQEAAAKAKADADMAVRKAVAEAEAKKTPQSPPPIDQTGHEHLAGGPSKIQPAIVDDPVPGSRGRYTITGQTGLQAVESDLFTPTTKSGEISGYCLSFSTKEEAEMSLRSILATIERAGCSSCAAALVCKRELKKYAKGAAA